MTYRLRGLGLIAGSVVAWPVLMWFRNGLLLDAAKGGAIGGVVKWLMVPVLGAAVGPAELARQGARRMSRALVVVLALAPLPIAAQTIGTAFTYQGRLTDAGNPANGSYDLQLALFDAANGGTQVGAVLTRDDVVVSNGLFTIPLDFGAVFAGDKRWLEIRVRPGASTGAYTTLAGRQELTPSPNAVFSSAAPWTGVSGKPAGFADDIDNDALGALACPNGQIAKRVAGAWTCQDDNAHDHLAQSWSGSSATGLSITNASGAALRGVSNGTASTTTAIQGEISGTTGSAIFGLAPAATGFGTGVFGQSGSRDGVGVRGDATATIGIATGVSGNSTAPDGRGVVGSGLVGVVGLSTSTRGTGLLGMNLASSGVTYGVNGKTSSSAGFGGFFENSSGGPAIGLSAGGIRFEDGTTQTTAAVGDITGVTAGIGLTGGAAAGNATLNVNLGGSGTSNQAARADHNHIGGFWSGPGGLYYDNTYPGQPGFWNETLYVTVVGSQSRAILGYATPSSGQTVGLWGQSDSNTGFGVLGYAPATSGVNYGVYGRSDSPTGYAGYFEGLQVGIPSGKLTFGLTARQVIDLNSPAYGIGIQGGVVYFRTEPPGGNFTWFMGGSHSNVQNDPGPGGFRQMRLDGGGNLFVRGGLFPNGADFAEMLAAGRGLEPGDVLAIGPEGALVLSTTPYQDSLAGVHSTKPGLVGGAADGESTEGKVPLAVAGIVPVKVTDEGGPIEPGDALTSSSTPGHAMKAAKVRVGGIAFFPSGVVIGKALEPLPAGRGVIRALVVLQ